MPKTETQVVVKNRKRGRPKESKEHEELRVAEADMSLKIEEDKVIMRPPKQGKVKELSARQLKKMELDQRFTELEQAAGRKLRQTRKGKVDGRCVAQRTEAQIEATKRMLERNRIRREEQAKAKNVEVVKETLSELSEHSRKKKRKQIEEAAKAPPEPAPAPAPAPPPPPPQPKKYTLGDLFS